MATLSPTKLVSPTTAFAERGGLVDQYFYLAMSLLFAAIVVSGFSRSVNQKVFHATIPLPRMLWIHAAVFSVWIVFYMFQSVLVRTRNVKWHRFFGWFGAVLGAAMVPLGIATAIVMSRFDASQLHFNDTEPFLIVPFFAIATFGAFLALALAWRKQPELHRRLLFIATSMLLDAPFDRFDFIYNHDLGFFGVDLVIGLGVVRDLLVTRRIHRIYLVALPVLIVLEALVIFTWHSQTLWWMRVAHAILA